MKSRVVVVAVLLLLLPLSGCSGGGLPQTENSDSTATPQSTQTTEKVTETASYGKTTTRGASTTVRDRTNTVEFRRLVPEAKRVFERSLANGGVRDVTGINSESVRPLFENDYVEYRGDRYPVLADRQLVPRYVLVDVVEVGDAEIENRTQLLNYSELTPEGRASFEELLTNGSSSSYAPSAYPFPGTPADDSILYVRYDGSYYELEVVHGDVWAYRFTVGEPEE